MIDKNELQELLVRLKLGTVSVDSAIEEIENNFYEESEAKRGVWKNLGFDEALFCRGKSVAFIQSAVASYLEKRVSFICLGLDGEKAGALAKVFDGVEFIYDAGMAVKVSGEPEKKDFKAVIITSGPSCGRVCREAETVLGIMGIDVEVASGVHSGKLNAIKRYVKDAGAVIVMSERGSLAESVGASYSGPVVAVPLSGGGGAALNGFSGMFEAVSSPWGVPSVNIDGGFAAAMAVFRLAARKNL